MADSIAQNYFAKFTGADASSVLSALPNAHPKAFEDNWLDFKSGQPSNLDEIWSKALGAMANAGGGVVIWGIDARKHGKPQVDAAEKLIPVLDVDAFASELRGKMHFATDPPLSGVRIHPVPLSDTTKEGFVVCLIPEGTAKPYQSLRAKRPFYIRIGDESKEPPISILRQLFYPTISHRVSIQVLIQDKSLPKLYRIEGREVGIPHSGKCIEVAVMNQGTYSLHGAQLSVRCGDGKFLSWKKDAIGEEAFAYFQKGAFSLGESIHPGSGAVLNIIKMRRASEDEQEWEFVVYAKDMQPKKARIPHTALPVEPDEPLILRCE